MPLKKSLKKIIGQIHLWLGLVSGLVVFVLGITGCIWAFEEEITSWAYADKLFVDASEVSGPLPLSENLKAAQGVLGPEIPIQRAYIKNRKDRSYYFRHYSEKEVVTGIWYWDEIKDYMVVYTDPYTAAVLSKKDQTFEFFKFVLALHWSLLLKNDIGQPIVGTATLIFVVMLITGLLLWWPQNKKALKMRTWFRWKPTTKWRRKNYDLHNVLGFYSMFLVVFIALTGLMWAFDWFSDSVAWVANGGKIPEETPAAESKIVRTLTDNPLDIVYGTLRHNYPDADKYYIYFPKDSLETLSAYVAFDDRTQNVRLEFDQYSGKRLASEGWEDKTNGEKVWAYNYDIHVGAIGGLPGKVIAFFLSLFSASLPVTGFLIWYGRKFKKRKLRPARKRPVVMEPANST